MTKKELEEKIIEELKKLPTFHSYRSNYDSIIAIGKIMGMEMIEYKGCFFWKKDKITCIKILDNIEKKGIICWSRSGASWKFASNYK